MAKQKLWENPWLYVFILALVFLSILFWPESQGQYDSFAQCLSDAGAIMYGTEWCSFCNAQKKDFGNSFDKINFVDCDADRDACNAALVTSYPTWVIDGQKYSGKQPLVTLASLTGCELTKDDS